jgi:hypothetical protein
MFDMRREGSGPSGIGAVLERVVRRIDPERRLHVYRIWRFWADEVGAGIAAHAQPSGFRAGVLAVRVDSPAWMQELQFLKDDLRARLNARLGQELVREIYFVSGPATEATPAPPPRAAAPPAVAAEPPPLPPLRDPRLAEVFARVIRAHAKRRRSEF